MLGDKNAQLGLWGLTTDRRNLTGSKTAEGVSLFYPNDTWNNFLGYRRVGDGFQPALGFVPRPGVQQFNLALNYLPRASAPWLARWLSQAVFELIGVLVTDLNGRWEHVSEIPDRLRTGIETTRQLVLHLCGWEFLQWPAR